MAGIEMVVAVPIAGALVGAIGWLAKLYLDERKNRRDDEKISASELQALNNRLLEEKDLRRGDAERLGATAGALTKLLEATTARVQELEQREKK